MKNKLAYGIAASFLFATAEACTAFQLTTTDNSIIYCRSMEYSIPLDSHLLIVPRSTDFTGTAPDKKTGMKWQTKYGYVGMNQSFARNYITDGMNEKGLIAASFYLPEFAKYESPDLNKLEQTLGPWELPSLLLGSCANIAEVKALLPKILVAQQALPNMANFVIPLHFYISDTTGSVLIIEYIDGIRHLYDNPLGTLTNSPPFPCQMMNLRNYMNLSPINQSVLQIGKKTIFSVGQGSGLLGLPGDYTPPSRFVRAALFSNWSTPQQNGEEGVRLGFHILNTFDIFEGIIQPAVDKGSQHGLLPTGTETKPRDTEITEWTIIHDSTNLKTYFRHYDSLQIQMVDLNKLDFTEPGLREIFMERRFLIQDMTETAQPIKP